MSVLILMLLAGTPCEGTALQAFSVQGVVSTRTHEQYIGVGRAPRRGSVAQRRLLAERAAKIDALGKLNRACRGRLDGRTPPFRVVATQHRTDGWTRVVIEPLVPCTNRGGRSAKLNRMRVSAY